MCYSWASMQQFRVDLTINKSCIVLINDENSENGLPQWETTLQHYVASHWRHKMTHINIKWRPLSTPLNLTQYTPNKIISKKLQNIVVKMLIVDKILDGVTKCFQLPLVFRVYIIRLTNLAISISTAGLKQSRKQNISSASYVDKFARSRYQGQGQVITSHRCCGIKITCPREIICRKQVSRAK